MEEAVRQCYVDAGRWKYAGDERCWRRVGPKRQGLKKPDMQSTQNSAKVDSFQEGLYLLRCPIHATRSKSTKEDSTLDRGQLLRPEPASLLISLLHNVSLNSYEAFPSPRGNDCSRRRSALGQR